MDETADIWKAVFARHQLLSRISHTHGDGGLRTVYENGCDCIHTVMGSFGFHRGRVLNERLDSSRIWYDSDSLSERRRIMAHWAYGDDRKAV